MELTEVNSSKVKVSSFDKSNAKKLGIVGNFSIGDILPAKVTRKVLVITTWALLFLANS